MEFLEDSKERHLKEHADVMAIDGHAIEHSNDTMIEVRTVARVGSQHADVRREDARVGEARSSFIDFELFVLRILASLRVRGRRTQCFCLSRYCSEASDVYRSIVYKSNAYHRGSALAHVGVDG